VNNRERFLAAMAFEQTDRMCHAEWGFWDETYERWKSEGLPEYVTMPTFDYLSVGIDLFQYFGVIKFGYILPSQYYMPKFNCEILEESDEYRLERNEKGVLLRIQKTNVSLPQFIDFPIKCRRDYEELKERLSPQTAKRYPKNWDNIAKSMREQNHTLVCTHMDGFFAYPRELMGLENFLTMLYDDAELIKQMIDDRVDFYIAVYEKAIKDTTPDFAFIWEDMSYKNGPLLSPAMFKEFMLPAYKKLTSFLKDLGVKNIIVDSDGDVLKLIPLWLEGGVTGVLPFEVTAGMDVVKIGEEFPTLQILGGINKHQIAKGKEAIDAELNRVLPYMAKRGGYCAALDHWVPPSISLENYSYFVERVREFRI